MTAQTMAWAYDQGRRNRLPSAERLLLIALGKAADDETMVCTIGVEALCDGTGFSRRQIGMSLRKLEDMGLLQVTRRGPLPSRYKLLRTKRGWGKAARPVHPGPIVFPWDTAAASRMGVWS